MARSADAHYNTPAVKDPLSSPGLRREIGFLDATTIVISGIIGGGIFFTPATVAQSLPNGTWILLAWAVGGVIALAGAFTFAELGARYPHAGGHYSYIRDAFGALPAFLYGWMLLLIIATGARASLALAFAGYVNAFLPMSPAQQQALIRELQRSLPPAQRQAIIGLLQGEGDSEEAAEDLDPDAEQAP